MGPGLQGLIRSLVQGQNVKGHGWLSKLWSLLGSLAQYGTSYLGDPNGDY